MLVIPAIDMLGGRVVRLYQGDYSKVQSFGGDAAGFAKQFAAAGAGHLHVVDLDGAKQGAPQNFGVTRAIKSASDLFVELGGGIRDEETIRRCFSVGVDRVMLGTAALKNPAFTKKMVEKYGDKICVAVDARGGKVAVEGWLATSDVDSMDFCREMRDIGVQYITYTEISRDGTGKGVDLKPYEQLAALDGLQVTAAGGVSSLQDIQALRELGIYGAILGRALYTGAVNLAEAVQLAKA